MAPGETWSLEGRPLASCRRGSETSLRHAAGTEPPRTQCVTQTARHSAEDAGGEDSDESDQEEEENQRGFPESWPTYSTAAAILGGIVQQHRTGEPPDKGTLLALAWKTSSLGTFASRLRKLGRRHTSAPNAPECKILEEQLQVEMALGRSPGTIKMVLSAATWAVSMGMGMGIQWTYTHTEQPCTHPACRHVPTDSLYTRRGNQHRLWRQTRPISGTARFVTLIAQGTPHQSHLPPRTLAVLRCRGLLPCLNEHARKHLIRT